MRRTRRLLLTLLAVPALAVCSDGAGEAANVASDAPAAATMSPEMERQEAYGHTIGSPDAPIHVVEFSDFGCPYCARNALETLPMIKQAYIDAGTVRWTYATFAIGMFPNGDQAALAAECAALQGDEAFWAMHDRLYERQPDWKRASNAQAIMLDLAQSIGLDVGEFGECFERATPADRIRGNNELARRLGVNATPTFFINGHRVQGALPAQQFARIFRELAPER